MIEPFLALEASAGSGKTFALSVRYIALILDGASVKSITALTFTKKAANEMSERIINTFLNLHTEDKKAELDVLCDMLNASEDEILARRDAKSQEFLQSELRIMTFDAFFSSILRSFSLNLGLSPDFDSKSEHGGVLQSEFIKIIAANRALLAAMAQYIVFSKRSQNSFFDTLKAFYENFNAIEFSPFYDPGAASEAMQILSYLQNFSIQKGCSDRGIKALGASGVDEIFDKTFLSKDSLNYWDFKKIFEPEMDEKFSRLKEALARHARHLQSFALDELNSFLQSYRKVLLELNARLNELIFSDITKLTHELLTANIDAQMLYFRLDARITHLLIDEFQDTNVAQYDIMRPLIAEIVAGYGQNGLGSFFYVGDIKQSIYRFRGGKKELFGKLMDDFSQIKKQNLTTNYRSARILVEFVNEIFSPKIDGYVPQIPHKPDEGYLKIIQSSQVIQSGADEVVALVKKGVPSDEIAVLCWKNDDVSEVCEVLNLHGIEAKDEGAMALKNSPAAFALVNYAKFCLFGDEIYHKNASAFAGRKLVRLKLDLAKTAEQNLYYLARKAGFSLQNLDILKLILLSSKAQNLIDFIFKFENSDEKSAQNSASGVKVMTVHKSKGLEFSHVVLLDRVGKGKPDTSSFICEYDINSGYEVALRVKNREFLDERYANLKERSNELDKQEEINKLYVAMTRAKSSLIIIKKDEVSGDNPSYFSAYKSGGNQTSYLELECYERGELRYETAKQDLKQGSPRKIELVSVPREMVAQSKKDDEKNLHAIYFGLALHYLLEISAEFSETSLRQAAVAMRNKFGKFLTRSDLDDVQNRALNLIKDTKFKALTSKSTLKKEQMLNFNGEQKQLDLLCQRDDEFVIIDYKSSKFSVEKNITQVREYVRILSEIYPQKRVRGVIFYALRDGVEAIEI